MFGNFKKKKKLGGSKGAVKYVVGTLECQLELSGFDEIYKNPHDIVEDHFFLGYIYGFSDCALQRMGVENAVEIVGSMTAICVQLIDDAEGPIVAGQMLSLSGRMEEFPEFLRGVMLGGNEAEEMLNAAVDGKRVPMKLGLMKHVQDIAPKDE